MDGFVDLDEAIADSVATLSRNTSVIWPMHFSMRPDGLWFVLGGEKSDFWLSDPFVIEAEGRAPEGAGWSLIMSWADRDGRPHRAVIRRADLAGDGLDVRQMLADRGLTLAGNRGARERFFQALTGVSCPTRMTVSHTTGWRDGSFVLPNRTIGASGREAVLFQGRGGASCFSARGELCDWQERVARPAGDHTRLVFALSVAFTGPLLEPFGMEGGGFHLFGPSSCGKTTALRIAGSVWGGGGERGFALTWRTTANALEGVAAAHNHTLLALDEIGQISPFDLDQATYALANGQAKARMRADGELRERARWCVPILSNGEVTIAERIREAGPSKRVRAGQEVRLVDVPAEAGYGCGIFDAIGGHGRPADLAHALQAGADEAFGTAGPAFVERLLEHKGEMVEVGRELVRAVASQLAEEGDGQVRRVAQRFALVAAAGEIATELGVLPWKQGTATEAVRQTFSAWVKHRGGGARREDQVAVEVVAHFLQRFGESRFALFPSTHSLGIGGLETGRVIPDLAGWRKDDTFLIQPSAWQEITRGLDNRGVAQALAAAGYLSPDSDGKNAQPLQIGGRKQRVYVVSARILEAESPGG
jgi:putative DNA primase/helicase